MQFHSIPTHARLTFIQPETRQRTIRTNITGNESFKKQFLLNIETRLFYFHYSVACTPKLFFFLFQKDCLSQQELVPIQYYHRPVHVSWTTGPLAGVVASLSTYSGVERAFLDELAKLLGAT